MRSHDIAAICSFWTLFFLSAFGNHLKQKHAFQARSHSTTDLKAAPLSIVWRCIWKFQWGFKFYLYTAGEVITFDYKPHCWLRVNYGLLALTCWWGWLQLSCWPSSWSFWVKFAFCAEDCPCFLNQIYVCFRLQTWIFWNKCANKTKEVFENETKSSSIAARDANHHPPVQQVQNLQTGTTVLQGTPIKSQIVSALSMKNMNGDSKIRTRRKGERKLKHWKQETRSSPVHSVDPAARPQLSSVILYKKMVATVHFCFSLRSVHIYKLKDNQIAIVNVVQSNISNKVLTSTTMRAALSPPCDGMPCHGNGVAHWLVTSQSLPPWWFFSPPWKNKLKCVCVPLFFAGHFHSPNVPWSHCFRILRDSVLSFILTNIERPFADQGLESGCRVGGSKSPLEGWMVELMWEKEVLWICLLVIAINLDHLSPFLSWIPVPVKDWRFFRKHFRKAPTVPEMESPKALFLERFPGASCAGLVWFWALELEVKWPWPWPSLTWPWP